MDDPALAATAREAKESGRIALGQLATLALRWNLFATLQPPPEARQAIPLLTESGGLSPAAASIFGSPVPWDYFGIPHHSVGLDQAGLSRLRDRLKALSPSERHAWAVPLKEGDLAGPGRKPWAHEYEDLGPLILDLAFKAPASGESSSRRALVVPSFGAIQASLDARFGEDAVQLMPVFGPSTADEVLSMIGQGGRVLGLAWPDQDPPRLEGKEVSRLFWTLHDVYHAYLGSLLPASYRSLFPRLAQLAREGRRRLSRHAQAGGDKGLAAQALLAATQPLVESLLNLDVQTAFSGWKGLGESLSQDFNLLWTAIVRDMARHPEAWPGVDAEREARAIGPMAARREDLEAMTAK